MIRGLGRKKKNKEKEVEKLIKRMVNLKTNAGKMYEIERKMKNKSIMVFFF